MPTQDSPKTRNAAGEKARRELLDRVVDYVLEHGVADLTLRRLAAAVGSNNRMLIYYFGGLEQVVQAALVAADERVSQDWVGDIDWRPHGIAEAAHLHDRTIPIAVRLENMWTLLADPSREPFIRLFLSTLGLAAYDEERYRDFLTETAGFWIADLVGAIVAEGVEKGEAELLAYEIQGQWRGLQTLRVASGDAELTDRVRQHWVHAMAERIALAARRQLL